MNSKKDIDNSNFFDWVDFFLGTILVIFYLILIIQEGFGFLFTPEPQSSLESGIPHIFILLLGIVVIVFSLKRIRISKSKAKNDP